MALKITNKNRKSRDTVLEDRNKDLEKEYDKNIGLMDDMENYSEELECRFRESTRKMYWSIGTLVVAIILLMVFS